MKDKKEEAVTLVALIITIIILIILAAVTLQAAFKNNFIDIATKGTEDYSKAQVAEMQEMDDTEEYLKEAIKNITGNADNAYKEEEIKIETRIEMSADNLYAKLYIEVKSKEEIVSILVNNKETEFTIAQDNGEKIYTLEKEIRENGTYKIIAIGKENKYNKKEVEIKEIKTDLEIANKAELEQFRDRVNAGETFEGRTVKIIADIDLKGNESDIWIPIGDANNNIAFKGTLDGNYHKISNLYYRGDQNQYVGFFSLSYGTIQNLVLENVDIYNSHRNSEWTRTAGVVSVSEGKIINCGINSGNIVGENQGAASTHRCTCWSE